MRIGIYGLGFELTGAIVRHVEDRVNRSLGNASDQVSGVSVRLGDINGDRGGADKRCSVIVSLRQLRTIVVEAVDRDLYAAVDEALARTRESVRRHVKRRRTLRREYANRALPRLVA